MIVFLAGMAVGYLVFWLGVYVGERGYVRAWLPWRRPRTTVILVKRQ